MYFIQITRSEITAAEYADGYAFHRSVDFYLQQDTLPSGLYHRQEHKAAGNIALSLHSNEACNTLEGYRGAVHKDRIRRNVGK